jgi:hypothetical protein
MWTEVVFTVYFDSLDRHYVSYFQAGMINMQWIKQQPLIHAVWLIWLLFVLISDTEKTNNAFQKFPACDSYTQHKYSVSSNDTYFDIIPPPSFNTLLPLVRQVVNFSAVILWSSLTVYLFRKQVLWGELDIRKSSNAGTKETVNTVILKWCVHSIHI